MSVLVDTSHGGGGSTDCLRALVGSLDGAH